MSPEDLGPGSRILVRPGEKIPLDGTVLEGESQVDASPLTGESVPVRLSPGGQVHAGTINLSGALTVEVTAPFAESSIARILEMVENAAARKAPTERFITRLARWYTPAVSGLALLVAVLPPLFGLGSFQEWIYRALVLLVISCLTAAFAVSPVFRSDALRWAVATFGDHAEYRFNQTEGGVQYQGIEVGWLPEGYVETSANDLGHRWHITYQNAAGERLELNYEVLHSGMVLMLDNEHSKREYVMIGNLGGQLFRSNTEGWPSTLLWFSEAGDVLFMLDGEADPDLLLQIAESVPVR